MNRSPQLSIVFGGIPLVASLMASSPAQAILTPFGNRAAWEGAVGTFVTEDFEGQALIDPIPNNVDFNVGLFDVFYNNADGLEPGNEIDGPSTIPGGGAQMLELRYDSAGADMTLILEWRFPSPVNALGANWNDVAAGAGDDLILTVNNVASDTFSVTNTLGATSGFAGFISDTPFTTVSISSLDSVGDTFDVDNVSIDAPTPIPFEFESSLGLLALGGMFGTHTYMKKRKKLVAK